MSAFEKGCLQKTIVKRSTPRLNTSAFFKSTDKLLLLFTAYSAAVFGTSRRSLLTLMSSGARQQEVPADGIKVRFSTLSRKIALPKSQSDTEDVVSRRMFSSLMSR